MKIIKTIAEITKNLAIEKLSEKKIALVPTMGALHSGHLSLVQKAREIANVTVVTIFVNKAQFNDLGDYKKYPRQLEIDLQKLAAQGVDYVFAPEECEIYPLSNQSSVQNLSCKITVEKFVNCLCAASRVGHFDGVALIITKLFNIIQPNVALFGEKDFQQVLVIKNLVKDFNFATEIFSHKTVREASGLAMSSRNQRLSEASLVKASEIFKTLQEISNEAAIAIKKSLEKQNENLENDLANFLQKKRQNLLNNGFEKIDYLEIRDEENLELFNKNNYKNLRIFIAIYLEGVRLIDNVKIVI